MLFTWVSGQDVNAQIKNDLIKFSTIEELEVGDNKVFSLVVKIENNSNDTVKTNLKTISPQTIKILSQGNLNIKILPNKKAFIPLKFILGNEQIAGNVNLKFYLFDQLTQHQISESKTLIKVKSKRNVKIFPVQSDLLYKQEGDSIFYDVRIINDGNHQEKLLISSSYPDYKGIIVTENKRIVVDAFKEKYVRFSKFVSPDMMKKESITANVSMYNAEGNFGGNLFYTFYNANSSRVYVDPNSISDLTANLNSNYLRVNYRGIGTNFNDINLNSHYEFNLGKNEFAYNLNVNNILNDQLTTFTDTWLSYQKRDKGLRLGTISYNELDLPVNGRGVMLYQNLYDSDKKIVLGAIESNYNLINEFSNTDFRNNSTFFAQSKFMFDSNTLESSAIFERTHGVNNIIITNSYKWLTPNKWSHQVKFGYGISNLNNTNITENSFSATANVSGRIGNFTFSSTNYFSSGYYPGTRRGALFLNQKLQRIFKRVSTWASFTITNNNPKPFSLMLENYNKANDSKTLRTDIGVNFKLGNRTNLSFSPKINLEKSYVLDFNTFIYKPIDFSSSYVNTSFSWLSNSKNHQIIANTYWGYYKLNNQNDSKPVLFGQFLWSYKNFQLNTSFQKGSLMIGEIFSAINDENDINRVNVSVNYRENFFKERLTTSVSAYYNDDINFGRTFTLASNLDLKVVDNLNVSLNVNFNQYRTKKNVNQQTFAQFSVQYNLPAKINNKGENYGNLKVFVYYDYNANGVFDEGDKISDNRMVKINDSNFFTSSTGEIIYKRVPYGEYKITIPGQKWFAQDYKIFINAKSNTVAIPMQLTGVVRGKLMIESTSKLEYKVSNNLFGVVIVFTHENGQKFSVKTNDRGEFSSYLPIGNYSFYILESSLQENLFAKVYMNKVEVNQGDNIDYGTLLLNVKQMKVNIKRFGS